MVGYIPLYPCFSGSYVCTVLSVWGVAKKNMFFHLIKMATFQKCQKCHFEGRWHSPFSLSINGKVIHHESSLSYSRIVYFSLYFSILGVAIATPSCFCRSSGPCLSELHIATRKGRPSGFLQSLVTRWANGIAQCLVTLPALKLVILCNRWWYTYPLKNMSYLGWLFPIYGKSMKVIKVMFQSPPTSMGFPCALGNRLFFQWW